MDTEDLKMLKLCLISLSQAIMQNLPDAVITHDTSFRKILVKSTKNIHLANMSDLLQLPAESILKLFTVMSEEDKDMLFACYVELYHALKDRDAFRACKAAEGLLENISALLLAHDPAADSGINAFRC
jgi:DNA-binding GntR family transcriptional regulator